MMSKTSTLPAQNACAPSVRAVRPQLPLSESDSTPDLPCMQPSHYAPRIALVQSGCSARLRCGLAHAVVRRDLVAEELDRHARIRPHPLQLPGMHRHLEAVA